MKQKSSECMLKEKLILLLVPLNFALLNYCTNYVWYKAFWIGHKNNLEPKQYFRIQKHGNQFHTDKILLSSRRLKLWDNIGQHQNNLKQRSNLRISERKIAKPLNSFSNFLKEQPEQPFVLCPKGCLGVRRWK